MRTFHYWLVTGIILFLCTSCNKDEGLGGSSSIQGYVYNIVHRSDNFSFINDSIIPADTIRAVGEKVYIVYSDNEDDPIADKDVDTNQNGMYHFQYLRKGNYIVYALSTYPKQLNKEDKAELQHVKVGSGTTNANPVYIHSGDGFGLSMIRGKVMAQHYDKVMIGGPIPAVETRVYLKRFGTEMHIDDVRVGDQGIFIFTEVPPGLYEVYTTTEEIGFKNRPFPTPTQRIKIEEVKKEHKVYTLPDVFNIIIND